MSLEAIKSKISDIEAEVRMLSSAGEYRDRSLRVPRVETSLTTSRHADGPHAEEQGHNESSGSIEGMASPSM